MTFAGLGSGLCVDVMKERGLRSPSDWPELRSYLDRGTVHVDNSAETIHHGVLTTVR